MHPTCPPGSRDHPPAPPSGHRAVAQTPSRSRLPLAAGKRAPPSESCGFSAVSGDSALIPGSRQDRQAPAVSRGKSPSPLRWWLACCQTAPKLLACPHPPTVFWSLLVWGWAGSRAESSEGHVLGPRTACIVPAAAATASMCRGTARDSSRRLPCLVGGVPPWPPAGCSALSAPLPGCLSPRILSSSS